MITDERNKIVNIIITIVNVNVIISIFTLN